MKSHTTIYSRWVSDFPGKTPRHTTRYCGWGIITMLKDKIVKLPYLAYNERFTGKGYITPLQGFSWLVGLVWAVKIGITKLVGFPKGTPLRHRGANPPGGREYIIKPPSGTPANFNYFEKVK